MYLLFLFLMIRRPPVSTLTDTLFPDTTLVQAVRRSGAACRCADHRHPASARALCAGAGGTSCPPCATPRRGGRRGPATGAGDDPCRAGHGPCAAERAARPACHKRSEERTSEPQSLLRTSYAVFCRT